jgi:hypothetical protein
LWTRAVRGRLDTDFSWRSAVAQWLSVFVAAVVTAGLLGAPRPKDPAKAPVFQPTTVGTRWVYDESGRELTQEVIAAEAKDGETVLTVRHTRDRGGFNVTIAVSSAGVFDRGTGEFRYDVCRLKFPVKAGQSWDVSLAPQKGLLSFDGKVTVGTAEKVEVPAGTFEAVPVRLEETSRNGTKLDTPVVTTWWWAQDVGVVRLQTQGTDRKLKAFTLGKK